MLRKSVISVFSVLIAVSALGQSGTQWKTAADVRQGARGSMIGTVSDVSEGQRKFKLAPDDDRNGQVSVETDAVSTQYVGFGGVINGSPEVFVGSTGFANIRVGDRLEVRGDARSDATIGADHITLLGRPIPADQTGVGQTRTPQSISSPTASGTTPSTTAPPPSSGPIEGVVRQVNAQDGRVVIETDRREVITIRGTTSTPVYYRNNVYKISNLEPGDRIRIEPDANLSYGGEVRAKTINVLQNVEEGGAPPMMQVGSLAGRVTSIDRRSNTVHVNDGRTDVPVDLTHAMDGSGRQVHSADMQIGDRVDLSGTFNGNVFVATTVHFADDGGAPPPLPSSPPPYPTGGSPLGAVTIYGSVTSSLASGPRLVVKDTQNGGTIPLYVLEDFAVRTKTGTYTTADKLKEGDAVVVKAYRDSDGDYIAQTIRLR